MKLDIRQLRYMVAVAEELHFSRAAQRLHVSQAPLSMAVQKLEKELGHKLFERTTRKVSLTPAGEEFYRRATHILQYLNETGAAVERAAQGLAGILRVGYVGSASYSILPIAVQKFRKRAPNVELQLVPSSSGEQADMLQQGELDLGIVRGDPVSTLEIETHLLYEEDLVVCLPEAHPLVRHDAVSAKDLSELPMVFFDAEDVSGLVAELKVIFKGHKFPRIQTLVVHHETALGFVATGEGFMIVPQSVTLLIPAAVRVLPLEELAKTTMHVALPSGTCGPAAKLFEETLVESATKHLYKRAEATHSR